MSSVAGEVAATIQAAHIRTDPDPKLDIAPSTAAEEKQPMTLEESTRLSQADDALHHDDDGIDQDDIPYSVLRPTPRKRSLPPLPDLRFEQSYLHSISNADAWWKVLLITARDQIVMPLAQGLVYNLLLCGWQHWNRNARLHGNTAGARLRRWWYGVNNWTVPRKRT
ncbi:hypothetical protein HRG_005579 [Hirsutella rhossiliensis]|uniref:DUF1770-domain-containing protein n=1 Tax=Hirsutella rhossiliensis TaxID=111463 RepID=A0A9P8MXM9_9HYPO|nr:uncharacterized protein HRG_05579 [Hirsutella rhossiliensis]KAH0963069.1 hypothetical protein HRG_05579 [Hirsutella rhossiliensis]